MKSLASYGFPAIQCDTIEKTLVPKKSSAPPARTMSSYVADRSAVPKVRGFRVLFITLLLGVASSTLLAAAAANRAVDTKPPETASCIIVGFVGGFVHHDNLYHGPVLFAEHARPRLPKDSYLRVFENRHRQQAYRMIVRLLDSNHDGVLSAEEKARARIVLYGHSWGGNAVVMLARELNRAGIPVLLTVQVDSVAKPLENDGVIPENVAAAVNFYQPHGMIHGRSTITAADPSKTQILGSYRFDYHKTPVKCEGYNWLDHTFTSSHMQSECDPALWQQVEDVVLKRIEASPNLADANAQTRGSQF
jgi:hypothetical protein